MAILAFQKPEKVIMLESTSEFGKFEFRPLEPGFGMTIGNALRRILLSSLEGYAITNVRITGVDHEVCRHPRSDGGRNRYHPQSQAGAVYQDGGECGHGNRDHQCRGTE